MSIDINEVSFKINDNRWLEIWVGDEEIVSVDTVDGGVLLCVADYEIGNIVKNDDDTFEFKPADEEKEVLANIVNALKRIERRL